MDTLLVPTPLRAKLGEAASDGLVTMFAQAHRIGMDGVERRLGSFEDRIERRLSEFRSDIIKWNCLFWIGQLAAMTAILSLMMNGR